jgi:type II secretory ATPase GspE/PulE/Tfp pilus assembly ATPase PilB-like protein
MSCKETYRPSEKEYAEIAENYGRDMFPELGISNRISLFRPKGCSRCNYTGFRGRMGVHELLIVSDRIKKMIAERKGSEVIRAAAVEEGMRTLLQDGIWKVICGHTDLKQIQSVCMR